MSLMLDMHRYTHSLEYYVTDALHAQIHQYSYVLYYLSPMLDIHRYTNSAFWNVGVPEAVLTAAYKPFVLVIELIGKGC
jgi:hypothetical protein